jgi:hypothetical protein
MQILDPAGSNVAKVNTEGSVQVAIIPPSGNFYVLAAKTGTIAAAAAAGAAVFAARLNPGYGGKTYIDRIKLRWTTVVAFTTPITQTRSLVITRGTGAAASGGTALVAAKKDSVYGASQMDASLGGAINIATTAALTVTGITFETVNLSEITLAHVGAAGAYYEELIDLTQSRGHPLEINPGEVIAVRVGGSAMDAAGTWSLGVEVSWRDSTTES